MLGVCFPLAHSLRVVRRVHRAHAFRASLSLRDGRSATVERSDELTDFESEAIIMAAVTAELWRGLVRAYVRGFPLSKGKSHVMETLAPLYATEREQITELPGGAKMSLDLREHVQRWIYFFGVYEYQMVDWVRAFVRPGMTFLDIGSHVGQYTLIAAGGVGRSGRVHAFEPNPVTYRRLTANIALNDFAHVRAHNVALSNTAGNTTLYVPKNDNLGEASLQACADETTTTSIASTTLDAWARTADLGDAPRIDLIKIDVQGFEAKVIEGARDVLERFRPTVLCEFEERWLRLAGTSSVDLKKLFIDAGYSVNRIDGLELRPVALEDIHYFDNLVLVPKEGSTVARRPRFDLDAQ